MERDEGEEPGDRAFFLFFANFSANTEGILIRLRYVLEFIYKGVNVDAELNQHVD